MSNNLRDVHIKLDQASILTAIQQIIAEEQRGVYAENKQDLTSHLTIIDKLEWINIDDLSEVDTTAEQLSDNLVYLNDMHISRRKIKISASPLKSNLSTQLLPLACIAHKWVLLTVADVIANNFGYYRGEIETGREKIVSTLYIADPLLKSIDDTLILKKSQDIAKSMISEKNVNLLSKWLSSLSYTNNYYESPDIKDILVYSGKCLGSQGWKNIATPSNILSVLHAIEMRVIIED